MGVSKLYTRFFDVERQKEGLAPKAILTFPKSLSGLLSSIEIIPVVYIQHDVFAHAVTGEQTNESALKIDKLVRRVAKAGGVSVREVQVDCDWTLATQKPFFAFVSALRTLLKKDDILISATIRLHQVKFLEKTGVPPVDRAMLISRSHRDLSPSNGCGVAHLVLDCPYSRRRGRRLVAEHRLEDAHLEAVAPFARFVAIRVD